MVQAIAKDAYQLHILNSHLKMVITKAIDESQKSLRWLQTSQRQVKND